jgi:ComF family protein
MVQGYLPLLKSTLSQSLDLLFPKSCFGCSQRIGGDNHFLCSECSAKFESYRLPVKPDCGFHFSETASPDKENHLFDDCFSVFAYKDIVRELIHSMKYRETLKIADYLADYTISSLEEEKPFAKIDLVCPVPLHPVKERTRGYNQSALLAKKIADRFSWQYSSQLIKRVKFTKSQSNLDSQGRQYNVSKAFSVDKNSNLDDCNVLLVDDVFTTGATVNAISRELKNKKVGRVYVLTIARA